MKASIVVPTYNRAGLLQRTLASLTRQSGVDRQFEVVVADDGSSDDTISVAESFAHRLPLRYFRQEDEGYRVAAARNAGARLARNEVLLFLDSGVVAGPDLVRSHLACHRRAERQGCPVAVIGYTYGYNPWEPHGDLPGLIDRVEPDEIVARLGGDEAFRDMRDDDLRRLDYDTSSLLVPWMLFWTLNCSVLAHEYWTAGGFDEDFRSWGCEDLELGYRLLVTRGMSLEFTRSAWAIESPHGRDLADMDRTNAANSSLLWAKQSSPATELHWGLHAKSSYDPLEEEYSWLLDCWRTGEAAGTGTEVCAVLDHSGSRLKGRVLVVGGDEDTEAVGDDNWTVLRPDLCGAPRSAGRGRPEVRHAFGLRTAFPDKHFDLVVLTSRLAPVWVRWGALLRKEASRVGKEVVLTQPLCASVEDQGRIP